MSLADRLKEAITSENWEIAKEVYTVMTGETIGSKPKPKKIEGTVMNPVIFKKQKKSLKKVSAPIPANRGYYGNTSVPFGGDVEYGPDEVVSLINDSMKCGVVKKSKNGYVVKIENLKGMKFEDRDELKNHLLSDTTVLKTLETITNQTLASKNVVPPRKPFKLFEILCEECGNTFKSRVPQSSEIGSKCKNCIGKIKGEN